MKTFLLVTFLSATFFSYSQTALPSYPDVIKTFFKKYNHNNEDARDFLNFAKKKNGWYVQRVNELANDSVLYEKLFWSSDKKAYIDLSADLKPSGYVQHIESKLSEYLTTGSNAIYNWIDYERCVYQGYPGWETDVINDFGNKTGLSDTMLESLARSYSSVATTYLWYQYGGQNNDADSLKRKLGPLELPTEARIEKVNYYINKAIETYKKLVEKNPYYMTLIGPAPLREFNECMNGYNQMIMVLRKDEAQKYIDKIQLDNAYIKQAKNYLNSCPSNAILFSYGDNDTYQLWYVQQKENFRKDVTVINTSLLGLSPYINMLKENRSVAFSADTSFYGNSLSDISYEDDAHADHSSASVSQLLSIIKEKKYTDTSDDPKMVRVTFPYSEVTLENFTPTSASHPDAGTSVYTMPVFKLGKYLFINDYMLFDIINTNIGKRPICFTGQYTTYFDDWLQQKGIVYQLVNSQLQDKDSLQDAVEKNVEDFVTHVYQTPIINNNGKKEITFDGKSTFYSLYATIADHYANNGDMSTALLWLNKALKATDPISKNDIPFAVSLAYEFCKAGDTKTVSHLFDLYAEYCYDAQKYPLAMNGYSSKSNNIDYLEKIENFLEQQNADDSKIKYFVNKMKEEN